MKLAAPILAPVLASAFLSLGSLSLFACAGDSARASAASPSASSGRTGSHGMVAFGTPAQAFVSHIPMFGPPHDIQAVVAGSFTALDPSAPPLPASFSDRLFTFLPDRMSLDAFLLGSLHELPGQIFLGNFESGGKPLPSRVRFVASRVVHQHVLDAGAKQSDLSYLLVGTRERTFAIHRITASPSFDEILAVKIPDSASVPTDADLSAGFEARFAGTPDTAAGRLGLAHDAKKLDVADSRSLSLKPVASLSCLVGPEFSEPCR